MPLTPPCPRRGARRARVAPALLAVAVTVGGCAGSGTAAEQASRPSVATSAVDADRAVVTSPATAPLPDTREVELVEVVGAPPTVAPIEIYGGEASLSGSLAYGGEAVSGATVRLERWVDGRSTWVELETGPGGGWAAPDIHGGRYVIRAWKGNRLVLEQASAVFIAEDEEREVHLAMAEVFVPEDDPDDAADEDEDADEGDEDADADEDEDADAGDQDAEAGDDDAPADAEGDEG